MRLAHIVQQVPDIGAVQCGDQAHAGKVDKPQATVQLVADALARMVLHAVPLVDRQHQRAPGLDHHAQQVRILVRQPGLGIDHQDHHVRGLDRL